MPEADEFALWRDSPITRWYLQSLLMRADAVRTHFIALAFEAGLADPAQLSFWRGEFAGITDAATISYDDLKEMYAE